MNAIAMSSPSRAASTARMAWASSPVPASRVSSPSAELSRTGGVALGDQRDALDRLHERRPVDPRDGGVLGREQRADLGELAVEQPGRGPSYAAAGRPSKPMMPSPAPEAASAMVTSVAGGQRLGGVGEHLGRDQRDGRDVGGPGVPLELAQREPVAVGGEQGDRRPSISIRTPVSTGSVSSRPAAMATWATALAKSVAAHGAGGLRASRAASGTPRPASSAG